MQLVLFNPEIGPCQVLPLRDRADFGAMTMKGCPTFLRAPALLEPQHKISVISRTLLGGGLTFLQRNSRCILQAQPTGQAK